MEGERMEEYSMLNRTTRSLNRYGLAMVIIAGAGLVTATNPSGADQTPLPDHECWIETNRICNRSYFPACFNKPDGTTCYTCPYTVNGSAHCRIRPGYVCQPTSDLPYDCGPKLYGLCLQGTCYGEVVSEELCTILQCAGITP